MTARVYLTNAWQYGRAPIGTELWPWDGDRSWWWVKVLDGGWRINDTPDTPLMCIPHSRREVKHWPGAA